METDPGASMRHRRLLCIVFVLTLASLAAACGGSVTAGDGSSPAVTLSPLPGPGVLAYEHMKALDAIGARVAGGPAESKARDYIVRQLESYGYDVSVQDFLVRRKDGPSLNSANIVATKTGTMAQASAETPAPWIIVGAHYDSVKVGHGAFDNGGGVGVMLEMARRLAGVGLPYTIEFVAFGAEEVGYKGSRQFFDDHVADQPARVFLMVNLDSVAGGDKLYLYGADTPQGRADTRMELEAAHGADLPFHTNPGLNPDYPRGTTGDWSDHRWFDKADIPFLYLEATNWNLGDKDGYVATRKAGELWHTKDDTLAFIEETFPGRLPRQLAADVELLQAVLVDLYGDEALWTPLSGDSGASGSPAPGASVPVTP